jgi:methionyl-tRNA formyltransferase
MRIIFAGTPEFARVALEHLVLAGHEVVLVLTQADRPAGRGMKLQASVVKQFAQARGIEVIQPLSLRLDGKHPADAATAQAAMQRLRADVMVVAAYGLILPQWVLDLPRLGCLNIHASLLPRWRGAAPIHRAIEAGDAQTGVTIMQMDAGLDTGDMLLMHSLPIGAQDTTGSLHDRLAVLGGQMVVRALQDLAAGGLTRTAQPAQGVAYARKIEKSEAMIDWAQPAVLMLRRIRAFNPAPGATTRLQGESIKVWVAQASALERPALARPGSVVAVGAGLLSVATMDGVVDLLEVQRAGGRRLGVAEFLRGTTLQPGMQLG